MKKVLALVLALTMAFSVTTMANPEEDTEKVLAMIKERIGSTEMYEQFGSSHRESGGEKVYNFDWYTDGESYKSLSITALSDGTVINYNRYDSSEYVKERNPQISETDADAAMLLAKGFMEKINPHIKDKLEITRATNKESLYNYGYSFLIKHMENGIPVLGDGGSISVSVDGKTISSFSLTYTSGIEYDEEDSLIDRETAEKNYAEKIGMKLYYRNKVEKRVRTVYPAYEPKDTSETFISALSGEAVKIKRYYDGAYLTKNMAAMDMATEESSGGGFSAAEVKELTRLSGLISKEEAEKNVRSHEMFELNDKFELKYSYLSKDYYDEERYYYTLEFSDGENYRAADVDAITGEILRWNGEFYYGKEEKYTHESAKPVAKEVLSELAGKYIEEEYKEDENCQNGYYTYTRYANGIPYYSNIITVKINLSNGKLASFSRSTDNVEFPSLEGIIYEKQAAECMFDKVNYSIYYVPCLKDEKSTRVDKAELLYVIDYSGALIFDAFTGEGINGHKENEVPEYSDIQGHFAEEEIKTLARYGIGYAAGEFRPDEEISFSDYLAFIVNVVKYGNEVIIGEGYDYSNIYRQAERMGIDVLESDKITRQDAAKVLIAAAGLDEVASLGGIYNCPFDDVEEHVGHISILSAMGVIKGTGERTFSPDLNLTKGAAAVIIYNYLSR